MLRRSNVQLLGKPCPNAFLKRLTSQGVTSFFGVPDSLLKELCKCITWHGEHKAQSDLKIDHHVIAANEGNAIGLAVGSYLASSKVPVVYMQNSGFGNAVNPLTSICHKDVYSIPMILLIGWRGRPGSKADEPQHVAMGRLTEKFLQASEIPYTILAPEEGGPDKAINAALAHVKEHKTPFAILIDRDTFGPVPDIIKTALPESEGNPKQKKTTSNNVTLGREESIEALLQILPQDTPIVATTGMISREVFETRKRLGQSNSADFLTVGAMGHASSIAQGVVLGQLAQASEQARKEHANRKIVCLDGDGAFLMHLGAAAIAGSGTLPSNLIHIVLNNGAHDSVGGQPTVGFDVDLTSVAKACGYSVLPPVLEEDDLAVAGQDMVNFINGKKKTSHDRPMFLEIQCLKGNRADLGRPTTTAAENGANFMKFVQKTADVPLEQVPASVIEPRVGDKVSHEAPTASEGKSGKK